MISLTFFSFVKNHILFFQSLFSFSLSFRCTFMFCPRIYLFLFYSWYFSYMLSKISFFFISFFFLLFSLFLSPFSFTFFFMIFLFFFLSFTFPIFSLLERPRFLYFNLISFLFFHYNWPNFGEKSSLCRRILLSS